MITVGRLSLPRPNLRKISVDWQSFSVNGLVVGSSKNEAEDIRASILGMLGRIEPVQWDEDSGLDGWYKISDISAETTFSDAGRWIVPWTASLEKISDSHRISAMLVPITRSNAHTLSPVRWHSAPLGAVGYHLGTLSPAPVAREGAEGTLSAFTGLPAGTDARWHLPDVRNAYSGAVELRTNEDIVSTRTGKISPEGWILTNGLIRISGEEIDDKYVISLGLWEDSSWSVIQSFFINDMPMPTIANIIRNEANNVSVSLTAGLADGIGMNSLTLGIFRGSYFSTVSFHQNDANVVDIVPTVEDTWESFSGGIMEQRSSGDPRPVLASAVEFDATLGTGEFSSDGSTREFNFIIGAQPSDPEAEDTAEEMVKQYLGTPVEKMRIVPS